MMIIWVSSRLDFLLIEAINANSALQLRKAIALAPRGERAQWLLCIQAMGTATKNRATFMGKMMNHWTGLWVADFQSHIGNQLAKYSVHLTSISFFFGVCLVVLDSLRLFLGLNQRSSVVLNQVSGGTLVAFWVLWKWLV
jgi:hypothetical protein